MHVATKQIATLLLSHQAGDDHRMEARSEAFSTVMPFWDAHNQHCCMGTEANASEVGRWRYLDEDSYWRLPGGWL